MTSRSSTMFSGGSFLPVLLVLSTALCLVVPAPSSAAPGPGFPRKGDAGVRVAMPESKPGEVIVVWEEGASVAARAGAGSSAKVERVLETDGGTARKNRQLLKLEPGASAEAAVKSLNRNPAVKAAGLNRLMHAGYTPSSPDFWKQWGLHNTGQTIEGQAGTPDADIDAVEAWDIERGSSNPATVAVIDSGIDLDHPNLSGRLWTNEGDPVDGVDNDGNGYIDDYHGYNWAGISNYSATNEWTFGTDSSSRYVAQEFTAQGTSGQCRIAGLEMWFYRKVGNPTQTITYAVRSSLEGANIVQTSPISPDRIAAAAPGSFVYEPFTSVANLTPGNTYFFVAYTSAIDPGNHYMIVDHLSAEDSGWDTYLEGSQWWDFDGTWTEFPGDDFYFKSSGYYYNRDNNGHGTHCCGIVGAADSGSGSVGVAHGDATGLMALKAGDSSGSLWSDDWLDAIDYACDMGADVISMSFGGTGSDAAEQAVITNSYNDGLTLFASSGNSSDSTMQYPVGYDNVIGVGATDNKDVIASFSTHNSSVDVSAPGVDYYSTMPGYPVALNFWGYTQDYSFMSGTSMACPAAAGLGALVKSRAPSLTPAQVQSLIEANADDKGDPGRDDYYGWGRINAFQTLNDVDPNPLPTITGISPTSRNAGSGAFTLTVNGTNFVNGSKVRWNGGDRATTCVSPTKLTAAIPAGDVANAGTAQVTVFNPTPGGGTSSARTFTVNALSPLSTWYLAEGTTAWGFDACISITNPNDAALTANVTYMLAGGATLARAVPLPALSQTTVYPRDTVGDRDFSTRVVSSDLSKPIAVDRTMTWTGGGAGASGAGTGEEAHSSVGVTAPAKTWYLPEGSTNWGFETWLCIQNPNAGKATCTVTYMIEGEVPQQSVKKVPPNSRESYSMEADIGNRDASIKVKSDIPVISERSMYRDNRRAGHESIGTTAPALSYYLAEGTTDHGFTTYLCIQNPNTSDITVNITYMTPRGAVPHRGNPVPMKANSRKTVRVNDFLPGTDFSTRVTGTKPIIAERAMYWDNGTGEACHDSIGMASPHYTFYLPDGQSSQGRETYTCVQNPNGSEVTVEVTYMTPDGNGNVTKTEKIGANSRKTFPMAEHSGIQGRASITVTSKTAGKKIMVERAMYWNSRGAGTNTIGGYE